MNLSFLAAALSANESYKQMKSSLVLLAVICGALLVASVIFTLVAAQFKWKRKDRKTEWTILKAMYFSTMIVLVCTLICLIRYNIVGNKLEASISKDPSAATLATESTTPSTSVTAAPTAAPTDAPTAAPTDDNTPTAAPTDDNTPTAAPTDDNTPSDTVAPEPSDEPVETDKPIEVVTDEEGKWGDWIEIPG